MPRSAAIQPAGPDLRPAVETGRFSKGEQIYKELKQAIISGELSPGSSIDKNDLCRRFGVSRLPVTNAVNRLAYERLVLIEPQRGSYVARIKLDDAMQWILARRALEVQIAGECARRCAAETAGQLRRNLIYQRAAMDANDYAGFLQLDVAFHGILIDGPGLHRIGEILDALRAHLDRVRRMLLPEPGRMQNTFAEHRSIAEAIGNGRPRQAERAMRAHVNVVISRLVSFERSHPEAFD